MRPQLDSVLESHLGAVLMTELLRPREDLDDTYVDIVLDDLDLDHSDEYYASFELRPMYDHEQVATTEFVRVRDTTHDHVATQRYGRESLDPEADSEQPMVPRYSTPYERIDIRPLPTPEIDRPASEATSERIDIRDHHHDDEPNAPVYVETADRERIDIRALPTGETTLDGEQPIIPLYSTPYDPTDEPAPQFAVGSTALPLPLYSVPYERVDLDLQATIQWVVAAPKAAPTEWSFEATEILDAPRTASRVIATIVVCVGATLLGLSIALYAT